MADLVPIKIKITRGMVGDKFQNVYPDFNKLPSGVREGLDWSHYLDHHGIGLHYDQVSGFGETDEENPDPTCMYCATAVPEAFATAARQMFPLLVSILTEDEFEHFYDNRAHVHDPEEKIDKAVVEAMILRKQMEDAGLVPQPTVGEVNRRKRALDPNSATPGIRKNHHRRYVDMKERRAVRIRQDLRKSAE